MAGLYEWWYNKTKERDDPEAWLLTGTIITTSATDAVARIHDRMPLVIGQADWEQWLDPSVDDRAALDRLMVPAGGSPLAAYPVSVRVNSVRNNGPELIEPLPLEEAVSGSVDTDGLWPPAPS
jgi:putative SOS response-associated peptidase YedK